MTVKLVGSSSGSVALAAPASTTSGANIEFKLPVADGSANQFLKTDGSGQLSFTQNLNSPTVTGNIQAARDSFIGTVASGQSSINIGSSGGSQIGFHKINTNDDELRFYTHQSGTSHAECARFSFRGALVLGATTQEEPGNTNTTTGTSLKKNGRFFHSMPGTWGLMNRNDSDGTLCVFARGGTHVGNIGVNSSSTSYNTSSDYRLKENVTAISDGITRLKTLKPSRFNFKVDKDATVDGFLAHEVTAVPEAITGTKDEVDKDNKPVYQGIDQSKLVPLLTAALQEAVAKIETLETKVAALEAK